MSGSLRISSKYIERERSWENEKVKRVERRRIEKFFDAHHERDEQMRLLSLPSVHWSFERQLVHHNGIREFRFFGLEWTWGIMELGRGYMPGGRAVHTTIPLGIGNIDAFTSIGSRRVVSQWLYVRADSFLSLTRSDKYRSSRETLVLGRSYADKWGRTYKRMTAVWLDFTSMICPHVRRSLMHVGAFTMMNKPEVPIAVTVLAARDEYSRDDDRISEINKLLNAGKFTTFQVANSWRYVHHKMPMLTVCGIFKPRPVIYPDAERMVQLHRKELGLRCY